MPALPGKQRTQRESGFARSHQRPDHRTPTEEHFVLCSKQPASVWMQLILPISWSTHTGQPYQSLVNASKHTQTLMISRKRSQTLVQRSYEPTCVSRSSPILKIPRNPANPASDNPPNTRKHTQTLMISRKRSQTLVQRSYEPTCVSRSSPILKIPKNPANPAPDNPPNTRKHSQTLMISRKRSQTLVQRSYEPTCVSRSSPILKIPRNPANPASDNPPNTRKRS